MGSLKNNLDNGTDNLITQTMIRSKNIIFNTFVVNLMHLMASHMDLELVYLTYSSFSIVPLVYCAFLCVCVFCLKYIDNVVKSIATCVPSNIYQIVCSVIPYLLLSNQMFLRKRMKVHPTDEEAKSTRHPTEYVQVEDTHKVLRYRLNYRWW